MHFSIIRSAARRVTPIAGRVRATRIIGDATSKSKKTSSSSSTTAATTSSSSSTSSTSSSSSTSAVAPPIVTPPVEKTWFQRNKQGMTNAMWSFVMFFMGIQVLRAKYAEDEAKKDVLRTKDELDSLKQSLQPDMSEWWKQMVVETELSEIQQKMLSTSLVSMLAYGEVLTVGGLSTSSKSGAGGGTVEVERNEDVTSDQDQKKAVRMI